VLEVEVVLELDNDRRLVEAVKRRRAGDHPLERRGGRRLVDLGGGGEGTGAGREGGAD
jgi:hypothetical protein